MIGQENEEGHESRMIPTDVIKVISYNIPSLQEAFENDFQNFVIAHSPDIICLQVQNDMSKLQKQGGQVKKNGVPSNNALIEKYRLDGYKGYIIANHNISQDCMNPAGTVLYTKIKPIKVSRTDFEENEEKNAQMSHDNSIMTIEFTNFFIVNAIAPEQGETEERVAKWFENLQKLLNDLDGQKTTILCGNFKVAHQVIDIVNANSKDINYYEDAKNRKRFTDFLSDSYVDIFRALYPEKQQFTYFTTEAENSKESNAKCRIDYFIAPKEAIETKIVVDCSIANSSNFSKHLPVVLLLDKEKLISAEHDLLIESLQPNEKGNEIIYQPNQPEEISEVTENSTKEESKNEIPNEQIADNSNVPEKENKEASQAAIKKSNKENDESAVANNEDIYEYEYENEYEYNDELNENESDDANEEEEIQLAHGHKIITRRNKGRFFDFSRHAVNNGKGKSRSGRKYDDDDYAPIKRPNARSKPKTKKTTDSNSTEHRGRGRPRKIKPEK